MPLAQEGRPHTCPGDPGDVRRGRGGGLELQLRSWEVARLAPRGCSRLGLERLVGWGGGGMGEGLCARLCMKPQNKQVAFSVPTSQKI